MRKSLLLSVLILVLFIVVGCSGDKNSSNNNSNGNGSVDEDNGESEENELESMTEEDITLTYASWSHGDLNELLAERFMDIHPNITVDLVELEQDGWNDHLINLASNGELPDVFWYQGNVDIAIRNAWLGDFTEYFENDPETSTILTTLQDKGYFDDERKMAAPSKYLPYTVFLDENLFKQMNVDMPSPDWTYSEMIDLMREMTIPEEGIFGYNTLTQIFTMAPIINQDADGEFGWDGEEYDLTTEWADAMTQHAEFVRSGVHAPFADTDEAEAAFGDREIWAASTGRLAMQLDAWWTNELFSEPEFVDKGIEWVPYVVPKGDNAETEHKPAFIDFGSISSATEHPREAYELLKFFGWGKDGWEAKLEAFKTMEDEDGSLLFPFPDELPIIDDEDIWNELRSLLPDSQYYNDFLERAKEPIPLGGAAHAGFETFLDEVYFGGEYDNVEEAIIEGEVNAHDIAPDLTEKINLYKDEALEELFY